MNRVGRLAIIIWLLGVAASVAVIARTPFTTDMSAFLPHSPRPAQQMLVDQMHDGIASRLILIAVEGGDARLRAAASQAITAKLRTQADFVLVDNGDGAIGSPDEAYIRLNRYLLSPAIAPEHFSTKSLQQALRQDLQLLSSGMEPLLKDGLAADPTGETLSIAQALANGTQRSFNEGVWGSPDGARAFILAQTAAPGFDIDAQEKALTEIRAAFADARQSIGGKPEIRLLTTGPGVFGVSIRTEMKHDISLYSSCAVAAILGLLLVAYRSPLLLLLMLLPVFSGALAGLVAVRLCLGFVHGVTVGFGVTLIGEAVDYTVYLFTQTDGQGDLSATLRRIWPTLRLGATVSICGFAAMLFSSFPGFEQLGIFTIAGLATALIVTRFVLPHLVPVTFKGTRDLRFAPALLRLVSRANSLRLPLAGLAIAAVVVLARHPGALWQGDLESLSPLSPAQQQLDRKLRQEMGAPDVRYIAIAAGPSSEDALERSEWVSAQLRPLIAEGVLSGDDSPDRYLPSLAVQKARQAALPQRQQLEDNLAAALQGLPFRSETFEPFVSDIGAARTAPPLTRHSLDGTALSLKLDSLLSQRSGQWFAVAPLYDVRDPQTISRALANGELGRSGSVIFLDLKTESDRLLAQYDREAVILASFGTLAITALLLVHFRSIQDAFVVLAPLAIAVLLTIALLTVGGRALSIFNLFGLLLVVAVGSNYCLFFQRGGMNGPAGERMATSLLLANICTVIGFGALSLSRLPVLYGLGSTVAIGTALSLVTAAILMPRPASTGGSS